MSRDKAVSHESLFICVGFVLTGLFLSFLSFDGFMGQRKMEATWKSTQGIITGSSIPSYSRKGKSNLPIINYKYWIDKEYQGTDKIVPSSVKQGDIKREIENKFPNGGRIKVFYNPQSPGNSVLRVRYGNQNNLVLLIAGLLLMVIGATVYRAS